MACKMCRERGQNWPGDAPKCAFEGELFDSGNWMCATLNALREAFFWEEHPSVDRRWSMDQYYFTIDLSKMYEDISGEEDPPVKALALWMSWYKRRGRVEAMWLLDEHGPPVLPSEGDCLAIIEMLTT